MRKILSLLLISFFVGVAIFFSCKKSDHIVPPIAKAGGDTTLKLSSCTSPGTVVLDGSGSSDPDNDIRGYLWTQISGTSSSILYNSTSVKANAGNLLPGQYVFQLQVTDAGGLSSKDTKIVNVAGSELESNLDLTLSGSFNFQDNYEDCYYYCSYYDYTYTITHFNLIFLQWGNSIFMPRNTRTLLPPAMFILPI